MRSVLVSALLILLAPILLAPILAGCAAHPGGVAHVRFARDARPVLATTVQGVVRGVEGDGARAFLGLPYAAAPVGERRWRAPGAPEVWTGVRDATRRGADCTQALGRKAILGGGGGIVVGSEDCLFVNVYAPAQFDGGQSDGSGPDLGASAGRPKPVMVYLHGGAFTIGAGANYDPSRLAVEQDRVVVTVNFRLGALGWLVHPGFEGEGGDGVGDDGVGDDGVGGNWGLMDQQAALRWVQANIAAFGGDPRDVTLFAESSGAWSACYLMASRGSEGLWSRVILQSGPCLEPSSLNAAADQAGPGEVFAERLGCGGEATPQADAVACLRALPARRLARAASLRSGINGPGSWGPVYGDPFVPISPATAFATGRSCGRR